MDLICFSHIKWNFVYQRPQHLLNRFAIYHRVFVIEEPQTTDGETRYDIRKVSDENNLWVVDIFVSDKTPEEKINTAIATLLDSLLFSHDIKNYILWYYSPMALEYSNHLRPRMILYDCMDELSAFKFAPPALKQREQELLAGADLVFTGGHSLYEAKKHLHKNIHPFPSSIDKSHFLKARNPLTEPEDQRDVPHPRFGFYGVIDERFDIPLLEEIAKKKPEWHFMLVGPVIKIDEASLPRLENIHYTGGKTYEKLPFYLSGWDIALLPFAINESTQFISPTKTPEYLAGGKPVISTPITDVVKPYGVQNLVHIAKTADEFIAAAEKILSNTAEEISAWKTRVDAYLSGISWNDTWHRMNALIEQTLAKKHEKNNLNTKIYV